MIVCVNAAVSPVRVRQGTAGGSPALTRCGRVGHDQSGEPVVGQVEDGERVVGGSGGERPELVTGDSPPEHHPDAATSGTPATDVTAPSESPVVDRRLERLPDLGPPGEDLMPVDVHATPPAQCPVEARQPNVDAIR